MDPKETCRKKKRDRTKEEFGGRRRAPCCVLVTTTSQQRRAQRALFRQLRPLRPGGGARVRESRDGAGQGRGGHVTGRGKGAGSRDEAGQGCRGAVSGLRRGLLATFALREAAFALPTVWPMPPSPMQTLCRRSGTQPTACGSIPSGPRVPPALATPHRAAAQLRSCLCSSSIQ